jgi:hypothetical protein
MLTHLRLLTSEGRDPFRSCRGEVPIEVRHLSLICTAGDKMESNDIFLNVCVGASK